MNTEIEIFPFLIGRNYDIDYRVIVTPDFISRANNTYLLSEATGDLNLTESNYLLSREVYQKKSESFTIFFQVKKIEKVLIDSINPEKYLSLSKEYNDIFLVDKYGREINLVEGFVVKSISLDNFNVTARLFEEIHHTLVDRFKLFWEGDTQTKIIDSRTYIESDFDDNLIIQKIEPLDLRTQDENSQAFPKALHKLISSKLIYFLIGVISFFFLIQYLHNISLKHNSLTQSLLLKSDSNSEKIKFKNEVTMIENKIYISSFNINRDVNQSRFVFNLDGTKKNALLQFGLPDLLFGRIVNDFYSIKISADKKTLWAGECSYHQDNQIIEVLLDVPEKKILILEVTSSGKNESNLFFTKAEIR